MFQYMYSPDKLPFFSSVEVSKSSYVPASQPSPQKKWQVQLQPGLDKYQHISFASICVKRCSFPYCSQYGVALQNRPY